ncbi:hypothetical protein [Clostridium beijerinckii]|jgi:flagellar biosynthesis chaperone FliJ|uniref:DUF4355 domain-containing protein n=2 Tax=Clostridium beijerinckii TaxID=1520 RepID=A0AAE2RWB1_CLOBE|nr:hypothetical protein [Clostridium beijerinckii]ABR33535.1 hypothetical protein Cbei_1355 [Clostridium beijerinckii NCIMB 8052]AIU04854.1 hypothetical protein Cbs_1355 [Clostridium beijerinckii ATCC 35702]MBF7811951.1 hypothetical protein [Clostridium beijerinckii]NRT25198.1 flagellar biosynthesis chaperone FliJ [Clostridium beijerinckii]NRT67208.1 flagellar biosynthesis chaperone FliJ [Clostridium beijerinckii]
MELSELNLNEEQLTGVNEYLESQIQAKLQSEGDKIRTKYNNKIKEYETKIGEYDITIKDLQSKVPVEKSPEQIENDKRIKALEDKAKEVDKKEKMLDLQEKLSSKGLNKQLHKFLNVEGVEDFETYLGELVEAIGKQSTSTYQPKKHVDTANSNITKADFQKMNYQQRTELYSSNPDLYKLLSK